MVLETSAKKDTFKPEWGESVEITIEPRTAIKVLMVDDDGPVNDDTMLQWPPQSILTGATYTGSDVLQLFAKVGSALELSDTGGATLILEGQRLP